MSMWGMDDGSTLTGDGDFTQGANTFASGNGATVWDSELEVGDCIIGADTFIYRIATQTANGAATLDRNYSGTSAADQAVTKIALPRHIKITNDDGTGMTLQDLGIFGISATEADAGVDNLSAVATVLAGSCHQTAPTITVAAPPTNTIILAKVNTTDNTIEIANHGFRTGTKLNYLNGTGSDIGGLSETAWYVIAKETSDSGTTFGDLTANTFALAANLTLAQAGTATSLTGTGSADQTLIGDTATAAATVSGGRVTKIAITAVGSAYTSAPTATLAAPATETINLNSSGTKVDATNDEITCSSGFYGNITSGDPVTLAIASGGTHPTGISNGAYYLIKSATSNRISLATTAARGRAGTKIALTDDGSNHNSTFIGQTPTATSTLGLGTPGTTVGGREIAHVGWVKKTIGTGGRAGRVHYETLVAASSISGDSEDLATPDS